MRLYITRHTETNGNVSRILSSSLSKDVYLTDKGKEQADRLAQDLKNVHLDTIYISELYRTKQTANIVNQFHNAPIVVDPLLNELRTGYEGRPVDEWVAAIRKSNDKWSEFFDGGESMNGAVKRTNRFLDKMRRSDNQAILVITHGFIVQLISAILHGHPYTDALDFNIAQGDYEVFTLK